MCHVSGGLIIQYLPFEMANSWIGTLALRCGALELTSELTCAMLLVCSGAAANGFVFITGFASVCYCFFYTLQARSFALACVAACTTPPACVHVRVSC